MEMVFMKRNVMYFVSVGLLVSCLSTPLSVFAAQSPARSESQPPARSESQPRGESQPPAQSETKPPARSEAQPSSESQPPTQGETKPPVRDEAQPSEAHAPAQSETKPPARSETQPRGESQPPAQSETKPPTRGESAQPSANTESVQPSVNTDSQQPTSNETAVPQTGNDSEITTVTPAPPAPQQNKPECKKVQKINVDALVEASIISKETGVKVKAYLKEYYKEKKAERAEVKKMKEEDRRAYYQNKYPYGEPDIWLDMAAAGILTLDEANAIKTALQEKVD